MRTSLVSGRWSLVSGLWSGREPFKDSPEVPNEETHRFPRGVTMEFLVTCSGLCFALGTMSLPFRIREQAGGETVLWERSHTSVRQPRLARSQSGSGCWR